MKAIEEFPNYFIDESGNVFNSRGVPIKSQLNIDGYRVVNLYSNKKYYHRRCARMVGLTHLKDTYEEGYVINHKDFDRTNDQISNLEWITSLENNLHSIEGQPHLHTRGSKYDEDFIRGVCQMIQDNKNNKYIMEQTKVTKDTLLHLRCGATWTWISKDYILTPSKREW
ncbi:homing endonuclease HNH [Shewanella sp. phage 1/4]|uniref:HNH endonuclease n=1 Tax=Shewanella phage 1/4 TaxID=1458859 RepID=UPI0004F6621C|nr:HNH endonuclease [Shewanella sp. phage 1/4]AHK11265.1 homing endonuclease HNH [Shewanella sp. phage 1/4]